MALALSDRWIWDFWTAQDDGVQHLFFLSAPTSLHDPDQRHWHARIGHATSTDLRRWTLLEDALAPSAGPAWDDKSTWTGSVVRHEGTWWMFYTGTSHADDGKVQRIGAATSTDLTSWRRHGDRALVEADPHWYELYDPEVWYEQAWRDPWVMRDGQTGLFHMFVTARAPTGPGAVRGVVGHATSVDLASWTVGPPVTEPGRFGHLEIPQVVEAGGRFHLVFASPAASPDVAASHPATALGGTHVLSAGELTGPYRWDTHRLLDGDASGTRYGGRLVCTDDGWQLLTWLQFGAGGGFVGELDDPVPVEVRGGQLWVDRSTPLDASP